jgi:hypothetical protein
MEMERGITKVDGIARFYAGFRQFSTNGVQVSIN